MLQDIYLICLLIYFNYITLLYLRILELSLKKALTTLSSFGIAPTVLNSVLTQLLTKRPNSLIITLFSYVNCYRILAKKKNTIKFCKIGK